MEIKPIETQYAGCRFRSRLEARWAVVFDHLDIGWEYELQGYEIPGGGRYLPDFWLPTIGMWAEVKGQFRPGEWEELLRAVGGGLPDNPHGPGPRPTQLLLLGEIPQRVEFAAVHALLVGTPSGVELRRVALGDDMFYEYGFRRSADDVEEPDRLLQESYILPEASDAYQAGRSARFEFGESG